MMDLVNGYTLMNYAKRNQLVLPAFNTTNYEMTLAIVKAFDAMKLGGWKMAMRSTGRRCIS